MDQRLRGKGNFTIEEIMDFSSRKEDWLELERKLSIDYVIQKIIIQDSKSAGWGVNYRVGKNSLCYIHPKSTVYLLQFK